MPDAPLLSLSGKSTKRVSLDQDAFGAAFHESLVHQSVRAEQAARRRGTAATKTRGEVSGGSSKPWKQKGTGRARAGSTRSPIWTGGGTIFGPQPRSYTFKVNRKERRAALRSALSLHAQRASLAILDAGTFAKPKTVDASDLLEDWGQPTPTLVVLDASERDAALSFRNIGGVAVLSGEDVGVADLLRAASVVISQAALDALSARAAGRQDAPEVAVEAKPAKAKKAPAKEAASESADEPAAEQAPAEPVAEAAAEETAKAAADEDVSDETETQENG